MIERRLIPRTRHAALVVQLYGSGIAIQTDKLWERFKGSGIRIPLTLEGGAGAEASCVPVRRRRRTAGASGDRRSPLDELDRREPARAAEFGEVGADG